MLTLNKCREFLGRDCSLSDVQIELLRDQMYGLADITISTLIQKIYLLIFFPFDCITVEESAAVTIVEA